MSTKLSQEQIIQQEVARQNAEFEMKQLQREENVATLGARCMAKRIQVGSPIIDKQSGQQKVHPQTGEPMCYPDKHYVTLQFMGGELEKEVTLEQYESMEEMRMFYCKGYIGEVKKFGNSFIEPIFTSYTKI